MIRRYQGALAVCALLIGYASLYPFVPLRAPGEDAIAVFFKPRYFAFDFLHRHADDADGKRLLAVGLLIFIGHGNAPFRI